MPNEQRKSTSEPNRDSANGGPDAKRARIEQLARARAVRAERLASIRAGVGSSQEPDGTDAGPGTATGSNGGASGGNGKRSANDPVTAGSNTGGGSGGRGAGRSGGDPGKGGGKRTGRGASQAKGRDSEGDIRVDGAEPEPKRTKGTKAAEAHKGPEVLNKAGMIGLLSAFWIAMFGLAARIKGRPEYDLALNEANALAGSLYRCLETLPGDVYAKVEFVTRYFLPWVGFVITLGSVISARSRNPAGEFPSHIPDQNNPGEENRGSGLGTPGGYEKTSDGLGNSHRFTEYR